MTIRSNIYRILIVLMLIFSFLSCKQETECEKSIYEISQTDQKKILEALKLHDFKKVIVVADTEYSTETINLCFQEIHDDSYRLKELYTKTNRFLKLSDKILIPTITSEDISLTRSEHALNTTGCSFEFRTSIH
jgi:ribosomal protein L30/L7E